MHVGYVQSAVADYVSLTFEQALSVTVQVDQSLNVGM